MLNIRDLSIRCGSCLNYQTLVGYRRRGDWNVYVYECEEGTCESDRTRTLLELPSEIDQFAQRDPECGGTCGCGGTKNRGLDGG